MKTIVIIVLALFCVSCRFSDENSNYYFTAAQPEASEAVKTIPRRFLGKYLDENGDTLVVSKTEVIRKYYSGWSVNKDSIYGTLIKHQEDGGKVLVTGADKDSVYMQTVTADTLFKIQSEKVAKYFKGYLLVNTPADDAWHVSVYQVHEDSLYISRYVYADDYSTFSAAINDVHTNADTTKVWVNPTRKELKKILKLKLGRAEGFRRIASR
ncbi:hypothetical protein ACLI08_08820 [Flavobacterium sp. RNTU_13]|uniref:hypothetical protein n=1 Tax=Flavobacterium sp. RNTU_13 TaxID=3375145 RepID=UPI0039869456